MEFTNLEQILEVIPLEVINAAFDVDIRANGSDLELIEGKTLSHIIKLQVSRKNTLCPHLRVTMAHEDAKGIDRMALMSEYGHRSDWLPVLNRMADDEIYGLLDYPMSYVKAHEDKNCKIYLFSEDELYLTELVRLNCSTPKYSYYTEAGMHIYSGKPEEGVLCCKGRSSVLTDKVRELTEYKESSLAEKARLRKFAVLESDAQSSYKDILTALESIVVSMKKSGVTEYEAHSELLFHQVDAIKNMGVPQVINSIHKELDEAAEEFSDDMDRKIAHVTSLAKRVEAGKLVGTEKSDSKSEPEASPKEPETPKRRGGRRKKSK